MNCVDIEITSVNDGDPYRAPVSAYPRAAAEEGIKIVNQDEKVIELDEIRIIFDYPLTNIAELSFTQEGGFTRKDLYRVIYDGYSQIYSAEPDPGNAPGLANRARSSGPFGIYGHGLKDLVIAGVCEVKPGIFELEINS